MNVKQRIKELNHKQKKDSYDKAYNRFKELERVAERVINNPENMTSKRILNGSYKFPDFIKLKKIIDNKTFFNGTQESSFVDEINQELAEAVYEDRENERQRERLQRPDRINVQEMIALRDDQVIADQLKNINILNGGRELTAFDYANLSPEDFKHSDDELLLKLKYGQISGRKPGWSKTKSALEAKRLFEQAGGESLARSYLQAKRTYLGSNVRELIESEAGVNQSFTGADVVNGLKQLKDVYDNRINRLSESMAPYLGDVLKSFELFDTGADSKLILGQVLDDLLNKDVSHSKFRDLLYNKLIDKNVDDFKLNSYIVGKMLDKVNFKESDLYELIKVPEKIKVSVNGEPYDMKVFSKLSKPKAVELVQANGYLNQIEDRVYASALMLNLDEPYNNLWAGALSQKALTKSDFNEPIDDVYKQVKKIVDYFK